MFHILNVVYVFNIVLSLSCIYFIFRVMFRINLIFINLYCVLIAICILNFSRFIFSYVVFNFYSWRVVIVLCFNYSLIFICFCRICILFLVFLLLGPRPKLLGPIFQPIFVSPAQHTRPSTQARPTGWTC